MKRVSLLLLVLTTMACNRGETAKTAAAPAPPPIGNAARGQQLAGQYGCNVCHIVPGVDGPQGALGPSLQGVGSRPSISLGMVPNTPENMVRFIQNPAAMNPQSSMPPMGMPENDAKDLAAYLLTLK
jgi:cytochrome c